MLKNYLLVALRNLKKNKILSVINILGLSVAVVSSMLVYIYVQDELSFDSHHQNAGNIYRLQAFYKFEDVEDKFGIIPFPVIPAMVKDYPEIEAGTRLFILPPQQVTYEGNIFPVERAYFADTNFFDVFDFKLKYGDAKTLLSSAENIVLTDEDAIKIFGKEDAVGEVVVRYNKPLKVSGIIDSKGFNTHIEMGAIMPITNMNLVAFQQYMDSWQQNSCFSYLLFKDQTAAKNFQSKIDEMIEKYILPRWKQDPGFKGSVKINMEPLKDIRFNDYLIYDTPKKGNKSYVVIFIVVAVFMLLMGCINYVNIATAAATGRAKEVGLRKVVGAERSQLVIQFLSESLLITIFSLAVSVVLLILMIPFFNEISGKYINLNYLLTPNFIFFVLLSLILVGLIAGSYPALYLSGFSPLAVLKGSNNIKSAKSPLRKFLVTGQFAISIFILIGTFVVYLQLQYLKQKEVGYNKENIIVVPVTQTQNDSVLVKKIRNLKDEIKKLSEVEDATFGINIPGKTLQRWFYTIRKPTGNESKPMATMIADHDFAGIMGIELVAGRYHDLNIPNDENNGALINETCVRALGWDNPLSEAFYVPSGNEAPDQKINIIGVVKDFHTTSLHAPIEPLVIFMTSLNFVDGYMLVKASSGNLQQAVATVKKQWQQVLPNKPFHHFFMEDTINEMYAAEEKMLRVFLYFALVTVLLSCIGLYGLSYFTTRAKAKEIGIRKVMGASVSQIMVLLNKEFVLLIFIAVLIAFPLGYYMSYQWLQQFAYRINMPLSAFMVALLFTFIITVVTVSLQACKTALQNPVNALRND